MANSCTINLKNPITITLNDREIMFPIGRSELPSEQICKDNEFIKCHKCKEYFDESWSVTLYHDKYPICKENDYCEKCFEQVTK